MNKLVESLQQLGLTSYEAKLLIALTQYGSGTVADIHALSGIPRSAVYGVITKLNNKGLIESQNTKPMRYRSLSPDRLIEKLKATYENAVIFSREQLELLYKNQAGTEEENSVWSISGVKKVNDKMLEVLESSREEIIFASSYSSLNEVIKVYPVMDGIKQLVRKKINEGVQVKITGREKSHVGDIVDDFPLAEIRTYKTAKSASPLKGGMLVVDNREILVITIQDDVVPPNLTATWYNGKEHARIFKHFIDAEWDLSVPIN